jgi:hypothetical protein
MLDRPVDNFYKGPSASRNKYEKISASYFFDAKHVVLKSSISCDMTPCRLLKANVSEEHFASVFRVEAKKPA